MGVDDDDGVDDGHDDDGHFMEVVDGDALLVEYAGRGGDPEVAGLLLARGAFVGGAEGGEDPLTWASRRLDARMVGVLLAHGAAPQEGWASQLGARLLLTAAAAGLDEVVTTIIEDGGVSPNACPDPRVRPPQPRPWVPRYDVQNPQPDGTAMGVMTFEPHPDDDDEGGPWGFGYGGGAPVREAQVPFRAGGAPLPVMPTPLLFNNTANGLGGNGFGAPGSEPEESPLTAAAARSHVKVLRVLLGHGVDVNQRDGRGTTPLLAAVETADRATVAFLLREKADIEAPDARGLTPLMRCMMRQRLEILDELIEGGARLDATVEVKGPGPRPEGVQDVLSIAVEMGADRILAALLGKGAQPSAAWMRMHGRVVLDLAVQRNNTALLSLLLDRGVVDQVRAGTVGVAPPILSFQPMMQPPPVMYGHPGYGGAPVGGRAAFGLPNPAHLGANRAAVTPFGSLVRHTSPDALRLLLQRGAMMEREAAIALSEAAAWGNNDAIRLLLANGIGADSRTEGGHTPLMLAASAGLPTTVRLLLEGGANPRAVSDGGHTALMGAVVYSRDPDPVMGYGVHESLEHLRPDHLRVIRLLLGVGVDVGARDARGRTALMMAQTAEAAELLLEAGAEVSGSPRRFQAFGIWFMFWMGS
jgi:ankyrin repeat protein